MMAFGPRNASIPNAPYSRPTPECLNPLPGCLVIVCHVVDHDATGPQLRVTRRCCWISVPNTAEWRPYLESSLAMRDGLLFGVVRKITLSTGPEYLFLGDRHVVLHIDEHSGLHEVTGFETFWTTFSAEQHLCAFFDAFPNVGLHALLLFLRHH